MGKKSLILFQVLLSTCICIFLCQPAMAQRSILIKGTILDEAGVPLPNVTVKERGTANSVVSSPVGTYSITVHADTAQLVFSHVGMLLVIERLKNRTVINVAMKMKVSDLNDVVVIGYGTTRRKDLTASVSTISKESLSDRTLLSLADAMKGKAAGVQIIQNDGTPGSQYT